MIFITIHIIVMDDASQDEEDNLNKALFIQYSTLVETLTTKPNWVKLF